MFQPRIFQYWGLAYTETSTQLTYRGQFCSFLKKKNYSIFFIFRPPNINLNHNSPKNKSENRINAQVPTSGRSDGAERMPSDRADRTELRIFSPTLDKSIPPPWNRKSEAKNKTLGPPKPSLLKSSLKEKGFNTGRDNDDESAGCISTHRSEIEASRLHITVGFERRRRCGDRIGKVSFVLSVSSVFGVFTKWWVVGCGRSSVAIYMIMLLLGGVCAFFSNSLLDFSIISSQFLLICIILSFSH